MNQDLLKKIAELEAANAALQAKVAEAVKVRALAMKLTAKGGISVYGLGRYPVTLYSTQWERLLAGAEDIKNFMKTNELAIQAAAKSNAEQAVG